VSVSSRDTGSEEYIHAYFDAQAARELATFFGYIAVELENGREHA
jgi:hypothetical protein